MLIAQRGNYHIIMTGLVANASNRRLVLNHLDGLGNFFFIENCFTYLNGKPLSKSALNTIRTVGAVIIGIGATLSAGTVWDLADFLNVIMAFINMPVCMLIGGTAYKCLNDYREKRKTSDKIHFHAKDIGLDPSTLDFWNE